jgi:hypothetical protein
MSSGSCFCVVQAMLPPHGGFFNIPTSWFYVEKSGDSSGTERNRPGVKNVNFGKKRAPYEYF